MGEEFRVCVVGTGAFGLAMARALVRHGIAYDQFERHSDVGGIWDQQNPGSPMYDSVHTNSSKTLSAFHGFPMPADYPDYPNHRGMLAYLRSFADAYDLRRNIRFATAVTRAAKPGDKWAVSVSDVSTTMYDAVVAATGFAWHPRMPAISGTFTGELIHSSQYRSASQLSGKRVLVIGAGNSGVDIACDAAQSAARAVLSMRRAYHFIPKYILGKPADVFAKSGELLPTKLRQLSFALLLRVINGDVTKYGLPKPDHLPLSSHPIINSSALLHMAQGDLFPSRTSSASRAATSSSGTARARLRSRRRRHRLCPQGAVRRPGPVGRYRAESDLFLRSLSRRDPTFAAPGFLEIANGVNPYYDEFADIIASFYREIAGRTDKARTFADIVASDEFSVLGSIHYVDSPRHKVYADTDATRGALKRLRRKMGWPPLTPQDMKPPAR